MKSRLIEYLGDTEELGKKAPQVLQLLQKTVSQPPVYNYHVTYGSTSKEDSLSKTDSMAEYTGGYTSTETNNTGDDTFRTYLSVEEVLSDDMGIQAMLRTDFDSEQKILVILTDIYDIADNRLIDTKSMYFEDTVYEEYNIISNSNYAKQHAKDGLRVEASFTWSTDGNTSQEQTVIFIIDEFMDGNPIISNIQTEAPRAKNGKRTIVLYDRESYVTEDIDYHYKNVMQGNGMAKLRMPFKGKVTVEDGWEIQGILTSVEDEKPKLCILLENGDGAEYSNAKSFVDQCVISDDKKSISWEVDDDWNTNMNLAHFYASTIVDLSCVFTLKVINTKSQTQIHPKVMINSVENPQPYEEGSGVCQIERIRIIWGCLAADTKIEMSDGSQKMISDIVIGDAIRTETGNTVVINIYKGTEKELVHLDTENNHSLRMTNSHPVKTTRGFIKASELTAADTIVTREGNSRVKYLYTDPYDNGVYNLQLEQSGAIICNGIVAGDFTMQNEIDVKQQKKNVSDSPTTLQKEFRQLFKGI